MKWSLATILVLLFFIQISAYSQCSDQLLNLRKTALIIGEQTYAHASPLKNTIRDANDMADSLEKIGYDVNVFKDRDLSTLTAIIDKWLLKVPLYDVALFYYSGHGFGYNGDNFLVPIDANPTLPNQIPQECISANGILEKINTNMLKYTIMILDACRTNPFASGWSKEFSQGGLNRMTGQNSYIGFAAGEGKVAYEGPDSNGRYTEAILKYLTVSGLTIDQMFTRVGAYVYNATDGKQTPYRYTSLLSDYCFSIKRETPNLNNQRVFISQPPSRAVITDDQSLLINATYAGISIKDPLTLNTLQNIPIQGSDIIQIVSGQGGSVVAIDTSAKKMYNIDTKKKNVLPAIQLDFSPSSAVIDRTERLAYVGFCDVARGGYYLVDLEARKATIMDRFKSKVTALALTNDNKRLYVLTSDSLFEVDPKGGKVERRMGGFQGAGCLGLSPNNKKILIGGFGKENSKTLILDRFTMKVQATLDIGVKLFSFSLNNSSVFAIDGKEMFIVDLDSLNIRNKFSFRSDIGGIAPCDDGTVYLWLTQENRYYIDKLDQMLSSSEISTDVKIKNFKQLAKYDFQGEMNNHYFLDSIFGRINQIYTSTVNDIVAKLGSPYHVPKHGFVVFLNAADSIGTFYDQKRYSNRYGIFAYGDRNFINTKFIVRIISDTIVLTIYDEPRGDGRPEVCTIHLGDSLDKIKPIVEKYFTDRLGQLREK